MPKQPSSGENDWRPADGEVVDFSTENGCKLGRSAAQRFAFHGTTPRIQYSTTGTTDGFTQGGPGQNVLSESTFTGDSGTTAYTIGDIVRALKLKGLIAS